MSALTECSFLLLLKQTENVINEDAYYCVYDRNVPELMYESKILSLSELEIFNNIFKAKQAKEERQKSIKYRISIIQLKDTPFIKYIPNKER